MVVMTAKFSKSKRLLLLVILLAVAALIAICVFGRSGDSAAAGPDDTVSAADNDGRVAFLASFGWTVNAEPVQTQQIRIPEQSSEVFDRYNELQRSQGYDLTQYAGQTVTRYVYEIQNYEDAAAPVYASVLVSDWQIIGGDVASTAPGGVMHGFAKPA